VLVGGQGVPDGTPLPHQHEHQRADHRQACQHANDGGEDHIQAHRTWSPRGVTPILRHRCNWKRASMAAALGYHASDADRGPRLCFHVQKGSYNTQTLIGVLEQLAGFYAGQQVVLV
jgi:hypothetical protein